jgi:thiamine-phosphate pyrophosphorylase
MPKNDWREYIKLYLITNRRLFDNICLFYNAIEDALMSGVKAVQLREKDLTIKELFEMSIIMRDLVTEYKAMLFINDRVDVSIAVNADGVHLGNDSIPVEAVKRITNEKLLIGKSTHSIEEAIKADNDGAHFITLGPIFETPSKLKYGKPIGVDIINEVKSKLSIPVIAIGGIKLNNVEMVKKAGADGIALITGILESKNIKETTKNFLEILR